LRFDKPDSVFDPSDSYATARRTPATFKSLLLGAVDDVEKRILGNWVTHRRRRNKSTVKAGPSYQASSETKVAPWKCPSRSGLFDPLLVEIIELV
jgi:hypothetical protein